ncbi:hypothetical protein EJ06DRAFT_434038 [Trichodelitschia bisporula]|uniref:Uncharacterized protein n=1 Tax=Trichodelitschia bisporula TaxID=703511 RepID=A0A6G1HXA5_9PEZI|nr:hypothetical protein EJ06DRAFT_434038 [Trichodelitschia bisporula]
MFARNEVVPVPQRRDACLRARRVVWTAERWCDSACDCLITCRMPWMEALVCSSAPILLHSVVLSTVSTSFG